jgi:hypothetical protein
MPTSTEGDDHLTIDGHQGPRTRTLMFIIGLLCVAVAGWELRAGLSDFGFATLLLAGAWFIGALFMVGAIFGEDLQWSFADGVLTILRRSPWRRRVETIHPSDVASTEIRAQTWSDGPDKFSIILRLKDGRSFETPTLAQRDVAQAAEAQIRRLLRV